MCKVLDFNNKKVSVEHMKDVVLGVFIQVYKDISDSGVNIPYFLEARDEYKRRVKSLKDLKFLYKKIQDYKMHKLI